MADRAVADPVVLGRADASQIAAFTRVACPHDLLSSGSVDRAIFAETDPQIVLGIYNGGLDAVGCAVVRGARGYVKFLAVHPRVQRRGIGTFILGCLEGFCRDQGATTVDIGTSAPWYVSPGVDVRATEAICFYEARGYRRGGDAVNLGVRLADVGDPELTWHMATGEDLARILPWVSDAHPNWIAELERSVDLGTCVVHRDLGFACYDVNRDGWFGPIASRPDARTRGVGATTLLAALGQMRSRGYERADIAWAVAFPFYVKTVAAKISRVFWWYRKDLAP